MEEKEVERRKKRQDFTVSIFLMGTLNLTHLLRHRHTKMPTYS